MKVFQSSITEYLQSKILAAVSATVNKTMMRHCLVILGLQVNGFCDHSVFEILNCINGLGLQRSSLISNLSDGAKLKITQT